MILSLVLAAADLSGQTAAQAPAKPKTPAIWELEWAYQSRYHDANLALPAPAPSRPRVVFMGDSITEGWMGADAGFFSSSGYLDRGISGQTTSQMLVRFRQDVIDLDPAVVVILGGTNDVARNGGIIPPELTEENLQSMVELARLHGIRPILCSILPAGDFPWRRGLAPAPKIAALNHWIASYCASNGVAYLDYYSSLDDGSGALKAALSADGVHPNAAGYSVMEPLARQAIAGVLKK
ncbi:MAG TPA: SGNH/GDSL hydrolase family protein [Opitutaceae bacterium]